MLIWVVRIISGSEAVSLGVQGHFRRKISVVGIELSQRFFVISSLSLVLSDFFPWRDFFILVAACLISVPITLLLVSPHLNRSSVVILVFIQVPSLFDLILLPSEVILLDASLDGLILISLIGRIKPFSVGNLSSLGLWCRIVPEVGFGIVGVQL